TDRPRRARGQPLPPSPPPGYPGWSHPAEGPPVSAALLAALLATRPEPDRIDLVSITVDDARTLQGKWVRVTFTTGCPSYSINGLTATGPGDQGHDGGEGSRGVVLKGDRVIDPGERGGRWWAGSWSSTTHRGS